MSDRDQSDEDRQLEPTERRLEKAREEGQFPQSRELTTLVLLSLFALLMAILGGGILKQWVELVETAFRFEQPDKLLDHLQAWASGPLISAILGTFLLIVPLWLFAMVTPFAMVRFQPVMALKFNVDKLNPIEGIGRLLSAKTVLEALKDIVKIVLILGVAVVYILSLRGYLTSLIHSDFRQALSHGLEMLQFGFLYLLLPIMVVALADLALQSYDFKKRMRMSYQEMQEELKESEGSPEVRARLRQRQRQLATSRMMSSIEKADVILVNPEHYAVALRYDQSKMLAPVVVAKGTDELALKIQQIAREFSVPIARIPPLARLMHQRMRVGEAVPAALFEAVAKVLAWAYEIRDHGKEPALPDLGALPTLDQLARKPAGV
jgi:flagellar biosynthetic protein FlhB